MKFTAQVSGEAALGLPEQDFELEAQDGGAAVDAVREHLTGLLPKHGGWLDVSVSCLETWSRVAVKPSGGTITETFPPGEVSRFSFYVDPHPDLRSHVAAMKVDAELAALEPTERNARRIDVLVSMFAANEITQAQLSAALADATQTIASLVPPPEAEAGKAVSQ